ncbi:MAG: cobalt transporter CbiM [Desulfonauticus sp.]|nr:cobalt transporter CbiM [Desulfonauticus sp.]
MHISEGVLSLPVLITGWTGTVLGLAYSLKKLTTDQIPKMGILAAVFFVASLIHVPIGPSSAHLLLNGLVGLLLGIFAIPTIFIGLLLQALLFQFGGLTTLGANTVIMSFPAVIAGLIFHKRQSPLLAGILSALTVLTSAILAGLALGCSGEQFIPVAKLLVVAHLPIAGVEAIITYFIISFILKTRSELLN